MTENAENDGIPQYVLKACAKPSEFRSHLEQPWTVVLDGVEWTVGTNGHCAAIVQGNFGCQLADGQAGAPNFALVFRMLDETETFPFDVTALQVWLGVDQIVDTCTKCKGKGHVQCRACDGEGTVECECSCGHEHESDCFRCSGAGDVDCELCFPSSRNEYEYARVFGRLFDRRLLRKAMQHLPFSSGVWRQHPTNPERPVSVVGDGWRVILMPLRDSGQKLSDPAFVWPRENAVSAA